jgi:hypothetical protein
MLLMMMMMMIWQFAICVCRDGYENLSRKLVCNSIVCLPACHKLAYVGIYLSSGLVVKQVFLLQAGDRCGTIIQFQNQPSQRSLTQA